MVYCEGMKNFALTLLAWIGTIASILGSFLVALAQFKIGYIAFLIGSTAWLIVAVMRRDFALLVLNATFFIANIVGIYNFILR